MSRTALLVVIILFPGLVYAVDAVVSPGGPEPGLTAMDAGPTERAGIAGEPLATPLTVRVVDLRERARAAVRVEWRVATGGGTITRADELTNFEGLATARWSLGPETGQQLAHAVVPQAMDSLVAFRAVARAGPAVRLEAAEEQGANPTVRVMDRYGNPVPDVLVTWMVRRGFGSMRPGSTTTNAQGMASSRWIPAPAGRGRDSILAMSESLVGSPVGFVRQNRPPPAPPVPESVSVMPDTNVQIPRTPPDTIP